MASFPIHSFAALIILESCLDILCFAYDFWYSCGTWPIRTIGHYSVISEKLASIVVALYLCGIVNEFLLSFKKGTASFKDHVARELKFLVLVQVLIVELMYIVRLS